MLSIEDVLNKVHLADYVAGYVTGTVMTWGFMQKTFIRDHKSRIEELKDRVETLEDRLFDLEESRVKIALKKTKTTLPIVEEPTNK